LGWDIMAISGGVVSAVGWYFYSTIRGQSEGTDVWTPLALAVLPLAIVVLRRPIDWLLSPIQKVRQYIPRLVIVGLGLAAPYGVAAWMYENPRAERMFRAPMREYPYASRALVAGSVVAYLILRTPRAGNRRQAGPAMNAILQCLAFALFSASTSALADHYLQDPWNLNDGLRTPGWAPVLAGTGATIVSVLINGNEVIRTLINPRSDGGDTPSGEEPTHYSLDIRTQDRSRLQRSSLAADGEDALWIYVQVECNKPKIDTATLTSGVQFLAMPPNADWLQIADIQMLGGYKVAMIRARPPAPNANLVSSEAVVGVLAWLEGRQITAPVPLTLEDNSYELEVRVRPD
jgi:hypothetical protein